MQSIQWLSSMGLSWRGSGSLMMDVVAAGDGAAVQPVAFLGGVGMILVALGFLAFAVWRRLPLRYVGWGALAWIGSVALKFAWAIPVNPPLRRILVAAMPQVAADALFCLYVGALTGIFEVGIVWLLMRRRRWGQPVTWEKALAFGIGFGVVEALLLGAVSLTTVFGLLASPEAAAQNPAALASLNNVLFGLTPVSERLFTILLHIAADLLVFYSILRHDTRWFWLAFVYKSLFDAIATAAQLVGVGTLSRLWTVEAIVAVFGIAGWLLWHTLYARFPASPAEQVHAHRLGVVG